jgi:ATP-dependent DNA helicase RecG
LVEESEKIDLKDAMSAFEAIKAKFPEYKVGLLHGKMKTQEKDEVMDEFRKNNIQILVATTVIEVGIDVPNATVMVIVNADRFGLSQLHQLRRRVVPCRGG